MPPRSEVAGVDFVVPCSCIFGKATSLWKWFGSHLLQKPAVSHPIIGCEVKRRDSLKVQCLPHGIHLFILPLPFRFSSFCSPSMKGSFGDWLGTGSLPRMTVGMGEELAKLPSPSVFDPGENRLILWSSSASLLRKRVYLYANDTRV